MPRVTWKLFNLSRATFTSFNFPFKDYHITVRLKPITIYNLLVDSVTKLYVFRLEVNCSLNEITRTLAT